MQENNCYKELVSALCGTPDAKANVCGDDCHPCLNGTLRFYQTDCGVLVAADIHGLPSPRDRRSCGVFGFHIHEGCSCTGNDNDSFANAGKHYNPCGYEHPCHAGDMPPLFSAGGFAFSVFLTDRFTVNEIIGKTVIIHSEPDDLTAQPAGNSGKKIACGVICR